MPVRRGRRRRASRRAAADRAAPSGIWHGARARACRPGQRYGFRVDGPWDPAHGPVFNPAKLLLDPYARAVSGVGRARRPDLRLPRGRPTPTRARRAARTPRDADSAPYVAALGGGARRLRLGRRRAGPAAAPVDRHGRLRAARQGVHRAAPEVPERPARHLRRAGHPTPSCTTSRTSASPPSSCCRCTSSSPSRTSAESGLTNYWGYNSVGFFAPHAAYSSSGDRGEQVTEFKAMVKALHAAGLEVILDVVYNHTAEGGPLGPTLQLPRPRRHRLLQARDWVTTAHVLRRHRLRQHRGRRAPAGAAADPGLAALLGHRDARRRLPLRPGAGADPHRPPGRPGRPLPHHDRPGPGAAAGEADRRAVGRQRGRLPGRPRSRRRGASGTTSTATPSATSGGPSPAASATSPRGWPAPRDLYADDGRSPYASVNFVTAHDGFTLRDLVSYDHKHNEANGEDNRDGTDNNRSWNCGVEGETDDPTSSRCGAGRRRTCWPRCCLSTGVPMITAGDERGRTQRGNNNAYCQDNEIVLGGLAARRRLARPVRARPGRAAAAARAPGAAPAALPRGPARPWRGGPKDLAWIAPRRAAR